MEDKVRVAEERLAALLEHQSTEGKISALAPKDMKEFPVDIHPRNDSKFYSKPESPKHTSIQARTLDSFEPWPPTTDVVPPDTKAPGKSGLLLSSHHGDSALQTFRNAESMAVADPAMASPLQTAGRIPPGSEDDLPIKTEGTCSPLHDTSGIRDEATAGNSPIQVKSTTPRPSTIFKEEQWTGAKPLQGEGFSDTNETKNDDIWFDKVVKEEAAISPANQLIYSPWSKEHVPTSLEISQKEKLTSGTFDLASSPQSTQWTNEMDLQLQQARQQGHNWATIAKSYFPSSTANACRNRHEKVNGMRKNRRNEYTKFELLATLYAQLREYTWSKLAFAAGEHWSICMGNRLEILLSTTQVRQHSAPPSKADASSYDHLGDSAIGLDEQSTELSGQRNVTPSINDFGSYDTPTKYEVEEDFSSKMEWPSVISNPGDLGPESSPSTRPQSMPMQSINQIRKKRRRTTPEEATHACRICGELFKRSYDWKAHMKTHNGPPMPNDSSGKPREGRSPRRTRNSRKRQDIQLNDISEEGQEEDKETTRCICGHQLWEDIGSFFIQCDSCR
ncbi:MAG: hypothetical protein L6R42_007557, partial [Xanthoria sp. 1 TBL-2021]